MTTYYRAFVYNGYVSKKRQDWQGDFSGITLSEVILQAQAAAAKTFTQVGPCGVTVSQVSLCEEGVWSKVY